MSEFFRVFDFTLHPKSKTRRSRKILFYFNFELVVYETQDPKTKKRSETKKHNFMMWLNTENFRGFRVFDLALSTKLKTRKSRKVLVCFKF